MPIIPFAATIGTGLAGAFGGSAAVAGISTAAATAIGSAVVVGGGALIAGASGAFGEETAKALTGSDKQTEPTPLPEVPKVEDAAKVAAAKVVEKKKAVARSRSIFTSPLGIGTQANTATKTLLGQ